MRLQQWTSVVPARMGLLERENRRGVFIVGQRQLQSKAELNVSWSHGYTESLEKTTTKNLDKRSQKMKQMKKTHGVRFTKKQRCSLGISLSYKTWNAFRVLSLEICDTLHHSPLIKSPLCSSDLEWLCLFSAKHASVPLYTHWEEHNLCGKHGQRHSCSFNQSTNLHSLPIMWRALYTPWEPKMTKPLPQGPRGLRGHHVS